jgi:LmbE family N-acetylglucosaminyl deacetylase
MTVVVIAAHPDDEILGAGATLARHVRDGREVHAVVLAEGATSRYDDDMVPALQKAAIRSAEQVGFASIRFENLPDQRMDAVPLIEVTQRVEQILRELRPQIVYTHFPDDVNLDHGVASRATWTACRPYALPGLRRFAVFETPSSTEWAWPLSGDAFRPNHFVDVSDLLDVKLAAMECYESELRDSPHPRSPEMLTARAATWGSMVGVRYAEPFMVLREVS